MTTPASSQESLIGQTLGHYRILERIGGGGMGVVYRAHDEHLVREVAIKVLPLGTLADDASRRRFHHEALTLSKLNHPNIATIFDFDTQQGLDFLVMEYIPGVTLDDKLMGASLPEKQVIALGAQLAEGLCAAHEHGVIHLDLKPGNLRLTVDGRLKILDFGLARLRASSLASPSSDTFSETKVIAGTLPYMAPEQVIGSDIDARTDIHAAGTVLYEMATGLRAFGAVNRSELAWSILRRSPKPVDSANPRLSPELSRIVGKCLEREPEDRYQSAKELAIDLRRLQLEVRSGTHPPPYPYRRWLAKPMAIGLPLFALAIVVLFMFHPGNIRRSIFYPGEIPNIESIAVLPLTNLSGDPQQDYFTDGMTEELITNLGKAGVPRVISRTSVMQYKMTTKSLPTIAQELNVDAVVAGSVLRSGNRVRITVQLIKANPERHLWAETYDRDLSDILALEANLTKDIAGEIRVKLAPFLQTTSGSRTVNPVAYEAYLQGRFYWNKRTREDVVRALEYFQTAAQLDPSYALAHVGVADSYLVLLVFHWLSPAEAIPPARAAALKALTLDEKLAEGHAAMALIMESDWDWTSAEKEYQRALQLNPNYATAHLWYSVFLSEMSRHDEAVAEAKLASQIDPVSLISDTMVGQSYYLARRYEEAQRSLSKVLVIDPHYEPAQYCAGEVFIQTGQFLEGIAVLKQAASLSHEDDLVMSALVYAYGRAGRKAEAKRTLAEWRTTARNRYVSGYLLADSYVGMGENEKAMQFLEKAYQERDSLVITIGVDPMLDPLRSDPRFRDLLRRMSLPQSPV